MKNCSNKNCTQINPQPLDNFTLRKSGKVNFKMIPSGKCKTCRNLYLKEYRKKPGVKEKLCERSKTWANKPENKIKRAKYRKDNLEHSNNLSRKRYKKSGRNTRFKKDYDITVGEYNKMNLEQNFKCKICGNPEKVKNRDLAVDHCHVTGKIRGLLCFRCNTAIGKFEDNPELLKKALAYLGGI